MQDPESSLIKFVHEKVSYGNPRTSTPLHQSPNDILLSSINSSRIPRRRRRRRNTKPAALEIHCTQPWKLIPVTHGQVIDCRIRMVRAGWGWGSGSRSGPAGEAGVSVGEILLKPFRSRTQSRLLMVMICMVTAVEGFSRGNWSGGITPQIIRRRRDEALGSKMITMVMILMLVMMLVVMMVMLGVESRGGNSCK